MSSPVLHLLAGPNGAGKTTFVDRVLRPGTHLPFVNADLIAADLWPGAELEHAYAAARLADEHRRRLLNAGASFITETVFSHPSKAELVDEAVARNYQVTLHVILVPLELTLRRVATRAPVANVVQSDHRARAPRSGTTDTHRRSSVGSPSPPSVHRYVSPGVTPPSP